MQQHLFGGPIFVHYSIRYKNGGQAYFWLLMFRDIHLVGWFKQVLQKVVTIILELPVISKVGHYTKFVNLYFHSNQIAKSAAQYLTTTGISSLRPFTVPRAGSLRLTLCRHCHLKEIENKPFTIPNQTESLKVLHFPDQNWSAGQDFAGLCWRMG